MFTTGNTVFVQMTIAALKTKQLLSNEFFFT